MSGSAGTALGDSSLITVLVYGGSKPTGKVLGTVRTRASGGTWAARPTFAPKLGLYTVVARQDDDAGHTGVSPSDTFLVVSGPTVIGVLGQAFVLRNRVGPGHVSGARRAGVRG